MPCASGVLHPRAELGDLPAAPIKLVHLNKCPVLAQANTLRPQDADRLGISIQRCLENAQLLRANPQVREKVVAVYAEAEPSCRPKTSTPSCTMGSLAMPTARR